MNKSMTRKIGLLFIFTMILAYFTLLGLLGEEGFLHARSIKREMEVLRQEKEVLLLQVDSLEQQKKLMSSQDALKDAAFRFGYLAEGEQVFYFSDEADDMAVHESDGNAAKLKPRTFSGFSKFWIALFALVFSTIFTVGWYIRVQRRDR